VVDDFNGYTSDANFSAAGETSGPWTETGNVEWLNEQIRATFALAMGPAALVLDASQPLAGPDCAYTVQLVAATGGLPAIAFSGGGATLGLSYSVSQHKLTFQNNLGASVNLPASLALIRLNNLWYAAFEDPSHPTWTFVEPSPMGVSPPAQLGATAPFGFGSSQGSNEHSDWDNFGIFGVPSTLAPN
jgi:hypothetical protein